MANKTILIVDDDSDLADAMAVRCMHMGLSAITAYDGLSAMTIINEQPPDLILLDLNLPLGNGRDVCRRLASDEGLSSIPLIVLSGCSDEATICYCQGLGAHYVLKSSDAWNCIKTFIEQYLHLPREAEASNESPRGTTLRQVSSFTPSWGGNRLAE